MADIRTINKSHFALWGNFIQWKCKQELRLYGEMRLAPKIGDVLLDGDMSYKFVEVRLCGQCFFAVVEVEIPHCAAVN